MVTVSSTIFDVVNLNDTKPLQLFLGSSQPKTQVYNGNTGAFIPDWNTSNPVLTPELYVAGTATNIIGQATSINWFDGASPITSGTAGYTLGTGNSTLTINTNLIAGNNLVPSFDSSRWFADGSNGAGSMAIDATDRYKMTLTLTATSQGRLVQIPVISGKTYTLSFNAATTGLVKLYKGQQTGDNSPMYLSAASGYSFTVDSSYNGYVTLRLVQGAAGSYVFQDIQLEMNATATAFAPMDVDGTKRIICEVVYTDPDTSTPISVHGEIDFILTAAAQNGPQGNVAGDMALLNNDTAVITTANDGTGGTYGAPNTQTTLQILRGTANGTIDVTSQYTISQTRNNVTVTEATNSATATVTAMSADTGSVVFTATLAGYPTVTKTFALTKSKMGALAPSPTDYWLNVSSSTITAADNGAYTPVSVTVSAESQTGTSAVTAYAGRFIIQESTDGSTFTTKYTSASDESSHTYTPSAGLKSIKVQMYQAGGTSVKLDEQIIPIIGNGKNSVTVNAWTPTGNIIRNAGNTVTAEADLLNGGLPDTGSNYRWVKGNGAATSVINGAGWEDLDLPKRNFLLGSNLDWVKTGAIGATNTATLNFSSATAAAIAGNTITVSLDYKKTNIAYGSTNPWIGMEVTVTYSDSTQGWYDAGGGTKLGTGSDSSFIRTSSTYTLKSGVTVTSLAATIYIRDASGTIEMKNFKLEVGSQATPWCAAYEESNIDPSTDTTLYGQNILRNTTNFANLTYWQLNMGTGETGLMEIVTDATKGQVIHATMTNTASWWVLQNNIYQYYPTKFDMTKKYSLSFDIKAKTGTTMGISIRDGNGQNTVMNSVNITTTTSWQRFYFTFTPVTAGYQPSTYFTGSIDEYWITNLKLEQLPYATDYTPNPADGTLPNSAAGANNWIYRNYTDGNNATRKIYGYSDFPSLTPVYQTLIADGASLHYGDYGSYFVGYYKTAVYVSTAKTINYQFAQDDTINILVNGIQQGSQLTTQTTAQTYPLSLQAGWNTIELILQEIIGNDGIQLTNSLSTLVEEMNCNFALDYGSLKGNYGVMGYNTSSMIVNTNAVTDTDQFMCLVTYRGSTYKDSVTIEDVTDPIVVVINGSTLFKNGTGTNTYTATLWQNGAQIDPNGTIYTYQWYVYNSDGSLDATFGGSGVKTGQTITVASTDINVSGQLQCQVYK